MSRDVLPVKESLNFFKWKLFMDFFLKEIKRWISSFIVFEGYRKGINSSISTSIPSGVGNKTRTEKSWNTFF